MKQYKFKNKLVMMEAIMTLLLYSVALVIMYRGIINIYWTSLGNSIAICISIIAIGLLHFRTANQIFRIMSKYKSLDEIKYDGG